MGHKETKWMFGSNTVKSLFQSWVIGMLLPGCSLGVIPIVKQLRRSGIAIGTIFAFALSSPLFDPMSLLYGLTLSKPITILAFATFSLIVVTIAGGLFDKWFPDTEVTIEEPPATPTVTSASSRSSWSWPARQSAARCCSSWLGLWEWPR